MIIKMLRWYLERMEENDKYGFFLGFWATQFDVINAIQDRLKVIIEDYKNGR